MIRRKEKTKGGGGADFRHRLNFLRGENQTSIFASILKRTGSTRRGRKRGGGDRIFRNTQELKGKKKRERRRKGSETGSS